MRVGIDVRCLAGSTRLAGVSQYTRHLVAALLRLDGAEYRLFPGYRHAGTASVFGYLPDLPTGSAWTWSPVPGRLLDQTWRFGWPPIERITGRLDVFFEPNFFPPPVKDAAVVTTVHDLSFKRCPEWFAPGVALQRGRALDRVLEEARAVIAVSGFTGDEIADCWPHHAGKVRVVHEAPGPEFRVPTSGEAAAVRQRLGLKASYYLHVGTLEARKNVRQLIGAFMDVRRGGKTEADLVLVGVRGFGADAILGAASKGIGLGWIRWLGYVEPLDLPALYGAARAVCYLSWYEGFGLPALEALACGAPVIASRIPVLQEILGCHAVFVNPADQGEVASALVDLESRRMPDASSRLAWARRYSWETAARETFRVFGEVTE